MPFYNKIRKKWIGQIIVGKKKKQKVFKTKAEARTWESDSKKLFQQSQTNTICLLDFATKYLDYCEERFARKTYLEKHLAFKLLVQALGATLPVTDITKDMVLTHLRKMNISRSGNAANKDRKNLVAGWNWAVAYIPSFPVTNPFKVERFSEERQPRYIPSLSDFKAILAQTDTKQDYTLLICYLHLGARRNELFQLQWSDISWADKKLRLKTAKRKDGITEYNWLPMSDTLHDILSDHKLTSKISEYVFISPKTHKPYKERKWWIKALCKKADVQTFGFHGIRHLTASILIENDTPLIDIQTILRHKSITTTEKYLHRLNSVRNSVDIFNKIF